MAGGCGLDRVARETVLPELAGCSAFQPRSYGHKPAAILDAAAVPGTTITVRGLSAGKAIAGQYCYLPGDAVRRMLLLVWNIRQAAGRVSTPGQCLALSPPALTHNPGLSVAVELAIIRQFRGYPPSAVDDQAIGLRATHQLVERARVEKDETRWTTFGDRPELPRPDDRLRHRTRHRGRIAERMIEVKNPHGLTEGINHVVIAISMERIAAIVAGDRDRYAALAHFVDRRDAAPARRAFTAPVLKIQVYGWQRDHRDTRLRAEIEGPAYLLFGLDRKAATMATDYTTRESVAQNCSGDMRERGRRRIAALVDMQIDVETAL